MKTKLTVIIALLISLSLLPAAAQASPAPKKILTQALIDKFIADLPPITKELEALGQDMSGQLEAGAGDPSAMQAGFAAMQANNSIKASLAKRGWNENFWAVYGTVLGAYSAVMLEDAMAQAGQPVSPQWRQQVVGAYHQDDLALVKKNLARLQALFDSLGN